MQQLEDLFLVCIQPDGLFVNQAFFEKAQRLRELNHALAGYVWSQFTAKILRPGVALAEIYDASINPNADYQRLVNISSRGRVTPDDGVLIGGFIVTGNSPKTLLIRGIGPALSSFGIAGALADPALTIYQDGKAIATNEGWANSAAITTAAIQTGAFTLPSGSKDAAVVITLNPGAYTAQIKSAKNASSGVALIEIYEVP